MRGALSLASAVLFLAFSVALAVLAVIVDMEAQRTLESDVQLTAKSVAEFVASQIRDAVLSASIPGVKQIKKALWVPDSFYGFDDVAVSVCVGNRDGNIYVNVTMSATRGRGVASAQATEWIFNVTSWAEVYERGVYLLGSYAPCPGAALPQTCIADNMVDLGRGGCAVAIFDAEIYIG
jgi:hypothetical protein